jgi:hypothetical protein
MWSGSGSRLCMADLCPLCHRGVKIEATYESGGLTKDCSYCSHCGKNWPEKPPRDVKRAAAGEV